MNEKKKVLRLPHLLGFWLFLIFAGSLFVQYYGDIIGEYLLHLLFFFLIWPLALYFINEKFRRSIIALLRIRSLIVFLYIYSLLLVLSIFNSPSPEKSFGYIVSFLCCFILAFSFSFNVSDGELSEALVSYGIFSAITLVAYSFIFGLDSRGRLSGFMNPNSMGMISVSIIMTSFLDKKRWRSLLIAISSCVVLYLTNSRAAIGSLVIGVVIYFMLKYRKSVNIVSLSGAFTLIGILIALIIFNQDVIQDVFFDFFALDDPYRGLSTGGTGRIKAWKEAWSIFLANPLLGVGYRMHEDLMINYSSAHNGYLAVLVDSGIIVFLLTLAFLIISLRNYARELNRPFSLWAFSFLCIYFFISFFERYLFNVGNSVSVLAIILLVRGFDRLKKKRSVLICDI